MIRQDGTAVPVFEAQNPQTNVFNSTVTDNGVTVPGRAPAYDNLLGYDADVFDASFLGNGATAATLRLATAGETFFPGVVTIVTDLYTPKLVGNKSSTVTDVDGDGSNGPGDLITYTVDITNVGEDDAVQAEMTDTVPLGTNYVPGSLTIDGTSATDAADLDPGDVVDRRVRATLGTPSGRLGGRLAPGATTVVEFQVVITPDNLDGASILNVAGFSYMGGQTGAEIGGTSNITQTPYTGPRADLSVTKVAQHRWCSATATRFRCRISLSSSTTAPRTNRPRR